MTKAFSYDVGAFLPTTGLFDESQIQGMNVNSEEFKGFIVSLLQTVNNIALITNIKESGYFYPDTLFVTGAAYFPDPALNSTTAQSPTPRQVVRSVVNFGSLPNAGLKSVAHNITFDAQLIGTRVYGCATIPGTGFLPLPNNGIDLTVDTINVNITTAADFTAYTVCYVVIEYLVS